MPHQVVKLTVHGSVGDLAKITAVVLDKELNILAIGGGEGVTPSGEVGVISMIVEPDGAAKTTELVDALQELDLGTGRPQAHVEVLRVIHIALANERGELNRAVTAVGDVNIRGIVSLGDLLGESHVALAFSPPPAPDVNTAHQRLETARIKIVEYEEEHEQAQ